MHVDLFQYKITLLSSIHEESIPCKPGSKMVRNSAVKIFIHPSFQTLFFKSFFVTYFLQASKSKKVAPAPLHKQEEQEKPALDPRIEKRRRVYGIGYGVQPKRDLSRYMRWPAYVKLQRQKSILQKRLKVPPAINQFSKTLDKNTVTQVFRLFNKYRPETRVEKKQRLTEVAAAIAAAGGDVSKETAEAAIPTTPKPIHVKYGLNHVTALIENKKAQLVLIAHDVDPLELVVWLPALCRKMGVPYAIVKGKDRLGTLVNLKKAAVVALTEVKPEHKQEFASILSAIKTNFNDKYEESRKQWGGNVLSRKSALALAKRQLEAQKALEARQM